MTDSHSRSVIDGADVVQLVTWNDYGTTETEESK